MMFLAHISRMGLMFVHSVGVTDHLTSGFEFVGVCETAPWLSYVDSDG